MHLLMSFVGYIGSLMAGSGLVDVLNSTFSGVQKMLTGKKYPDNVRALRMLTEELLRPIIEEEATTDMEDLLKVLEEKGKQSRTAKLWVTCLIKPIFNIMKFVRAERESDWALHLAAVREMIPLCFATSHFNYARYGIYYLRSMERLPIEVRKHFGKQGTYRPPQVRSFQWYLDGYGNRNHATS